MQKIASELAGKTIFSPFDLKDGYWQVKLYMLQVQVY